jgi:hypothetical protein
VLDYPGMRALAREIQVSARDLLAMADFNDPFYTGVPYRVANARWFANLGERIDFGHRFHIRRVHYKLVSQSPPIRKPNGENYENTDQDWDLLLRASRDARYLGLIDPEQVVDSRNPAATINAVLGPALSPSIEVMNLELYEMDLPEQLDLPELLLEEFRAQQRYLVEIWTEKSGQNDVLRPLVKRYGVNLVSFDGECSEAGCRAAIRRAIESGWPLRIIYLSDFDPGGRSMPVAAGRKIEFWLRHNHPDLDVTVDPIALLPEQAEEYGLPRTPIKAGEKRATKFEERFGRGATEIDALEALHPGELKKIVEAGILRHLDPDLDQREQEIRRQINKEIGQAEDLVHHKYRSQIRAVQDEYSQLRQQMIELRQRTEGLWQAIGDDLLAEAPHVSADDVPEPHEESDQLAPLFDSRRDYLTQIDWYRRWQGRAP